MHVQHYILLVGAAGYERARPQASPYASDHSHANEPFSGSENGTSGGMASLRNSVSQWLTGIGGMGLFNGKHADSRNSTAGDSLHGDYTHVSNHVHSARDSQRSEFLSGNLDHHYSLRQVLNPKP